jgi:hypothetical protein
MGPDGGALVGWWFAAVARRRAASLTSSNNMTLIFVGRLADGRDQPTGVPTESAEAPVGSDHLADLRPILIR